MNNQTDPDDEDCTPASDAMMQTFFQYREICLAHAIKSAQPSDTTEAILIRARAFFNFVWDEETEVSTDTPRQNH